MPPRTWTIVACDELLNWYDFQDEIWKTEETETLFSNFPNLFSAAMSAEIEDGKDLRLTLEPLSKMAASTSQPFYSSPG